MANTNAPFGFIPTRHLMGGILRSNNSGPWYIASGYATSIFDGDVVIATATGPYINRAPNNSALIAGVFSGVLFTNPLDGRPWWTNMWVGAQVSVGALDTPAFIMDDPNTVFKAQCLTGTAFTATMVNNNAPIDVTAGSTATRRSAESVSVASTATTTDQIRILGLTGLPDNALGDSAIIDCKFNQHLLIGATGA